MGRRFQRWLAVLAFAAVAACAQAPAARESLNDAWWTGPMLANSAATLPRGHFLLEPYFYEIAAAHAVSFGTRAYALYGLRDGWTVGFIPIGSFANRLPASRSGPGIGDWSLISQVHLTGSAGTRRPTVSIMFEESLPIAPYDRLGARPSDGLGSGAYATTLGLNTQKYLWLPNGRILRTRFNISEQWSRHASVEDASVYGTPDGFRGVALPGREFYADGAAEYSLTRRWVLAMDITYGHNGSTAVRGTRQGAPVAFDSGSSDGMGFAPAVEYNLSPNLGFLVGVRLLGAGHNTPASVTPALAINWVR